MQRKEAAITKGPDDIAGVRTKRTFLEDSANVRTPVKTDAWFLYAAKDISLSRLASPIVKKWKWTKVTDRMLLARIQEMARRYNVDLITTKEPPEGVM